MNKKIVSEGINMISLDDMPFNNAITLDYEKHLTMQSGDMKKLLELKYLFSFDFVNIL